LIFDMFPVNNLYIMKKISLLFAVVIFSGMLTSFYYHPNATGDINPAVAEALRTGNSKELAKYFYSSIEITEPEHEGTFSKTQGEQMVNNFFKANVPKSFTINNQGASKGNSRFTIGTLVTVKGTFRTYYLIKNISGENYIQLLQFELQKR